MLSNPSTITSTDFINGSAIATGTVVTLPANRYFSMDIQLSSTHQGATTATPKVTYNTSGGVLFSPTTGSIVCQQKIAGLLAVAVQSDARIEFSGYTGSGGATLDFNTGGATVSSCVINGFLL